MHTHRLYVLDPNVLMHDPTALFRFHEHSLFLPMIVLEELDRSKREGYRAQSFDDLDYDYLSEYEG